MLSTTKPVRSKAKIPRGFDKHQNNQPFVYAYTFPKPFALSVLLAIDGVERCAFQVRCRLHTLQMARQKTASLLVLPVCVSVWRQWLSYKWKKNPKAKVNSFRTILKRSFSLAFMRANFYSPNANSQFSCICIWRQVRRESDHFDYFPVSFFGFQCNCDSAETSLQVVILSHHWNWSTFWPKLAKTGQNGLCAQCAFAQPHARKSWGVICFIPGPELKLN